MLAILRSHRFNPSAQIDTLQSLSGGESRLDRSTDSSGLRRMADAFEGKVDEDNEEAGEEVTDLAAALEEIGRGITGYTQERGGRETEECLRYESYDSIAASLASLWIDSA